VSADAPAAEPASAAISAPAAPPSSRALFLAFLAIALSGFGGVLPFARRSLVDKHGWLTAQDFTETLSLCQSLPGPNVVNLSIAVGARAQGWRGSLAALSGLVLGPVAIVVTLGALYDRFGNLPISRGALTGLGASAAGLVVATAARLAEPVLRQRFWLGAVFIAASFIGVGVLRFPLGYVLLVLAPISVGLVWRRRS
jgi:chromate transporter